MAYRMAEGVNWDDFDEALSAVRDIGPGGHYLGHAHTLANFKEAFFMPRLFDNNSFEQWLAEGSVSITERALNEAKLLLNSYEEPTLDAAVNPLCNDASVHKTSTRLSIGSRSVSLECIVTA